MALSWLQGSIAPTDEDISSMSEILPKRYLLETLKENLSIRYKEKANFALHTQEIYKGCTHTSIVFAYVYVNSNTRCTRLRTTKHEILK